MHVTSGHEALDLIRGGRQVCLFDFDGTLVDSAPGVVACLDRAFAESGLQPVKGIDRSVIGPPLRKMLEQLSGVTEAKVLDALGASFRAAYDTWGCLETVPYDGILEVLRQLRRSGKRVYVVTNKRSEPTHKIIDHLAWRGNFDGVFTLDGETPPVESKSRLVRNVIGRHLLDVRDTVMVGDTLEDAAAAEDSGLRFVGVSWGYGSWSAPEDSGRVRVVSRPAELLTPGYLFSAEEWRVKP